MNELPPGKASTQPLWDVVVLAPGTKIPQKVSFFDDDKWPTESVTIEKEKWTKQKGRDYPEYISNGKMPANVHFVATAMSLQMHHLGVRMVDPAVYAAATEEIVRWRRMATVQIKLGSTLYMQLPADLVPSSVGPASVSVAAADLVAFTTTHCEPNRSVYPLVVNQEALELDKDVGLQVSLETPQGAFVPSLPIALRFTFHGVTINK